MVGWMEGGGCSYRNLCESTFLGSENPQADGPHKYCRASSGSFSIYEQPKWERIVASTQVGFRVSIWVRIRVWIRVRIRVRDRVRLGLYSGCSYIEKGPIKYSSS